MRLGIGSYTFGWAVQEGAMDARAIVDRAAAWGVGVVQLCNNLPPQTYELGNVRALAEHARATGVALELGVQGCRPAHLRRMIALAKEMGSWILRVVVEEADDRPTPEQVVQRLAEVQPELRAAGITLAIENHDRLPADVLADVVGRLHSDHVGVCLDTVNSLGVPEGPKEVVAALGPYVVNLHLKDFHIQRVPWIQGFSLEGRPAGEGMLNIPWLLGQLGRFGRMRSAIIEVWTPPQPDVQRTIEQELEWAERSVRNVRQWIVD